MNIRHVVNSLDPAQGGLPAVALRLATAQAALGHNVTVVSQDPPERLIDLFCAHGIKPNVEFPKIGVVPPKLPAVLGNRDTNGEIADMLASCDIVHLHGLWEPLVACVAAQAVQRRIPFVIAPHGMVDPWSLSQKRWKKRIALALRYRRLLNKAAFVHALNDAEAGFLRGIGVSSSIEILPNGVFLEEIDVENDTNSDYFQERFGWPGNQTLLFLGRLHWKKGLDILAEAFAKFSSERPAARLVVAGPDGGWRTPFQQRVDHLGISDRVAVPGPIYGREKYRALRDAAMFVLPSRQEGFSVAILEALACGTPVIISEACHFPEVAACGAGAVVDLSLARHAAVWRELLDNRERATRMGEAGRKLVASRYTWESVARRSIDLYARCRGRPISEVVSC